MAHLNTQNLLETVNSGWIAETAKPTKAHRNLKSTRLAICITEASTMVDSAFRYLSLGYQDLWFGCQMSTQLAKITAKQRKTSLMLQLVGKTHCCIVSSQYNIFDEICIIYIIEGKRIYNQYLQSGQITPKQSG